MADVDGKYLTRRHSQMKAQRAILDTHCQEIAQLVIPYLSVFQQQHLSQMQGEKRTTKLMESTAPLALTRYASAIEGFLVPRGEKWSRLTTNDKRLNQSPRVKAFFDEANDLLFNVRYDPRAGFQSQMHGCLTGVGAFGTTGLFVDGTVKTLNDGGITTGTRYAAIPLVHLYISQGANGLVDTVHREWRHTARNCVTDFGDDCPQEIKDAAEKDPDQEFTIVHIVMPNPERIINAPGVRGMPFASFYLWLDKSQIIQRGGYNTLRYAIARGPAGPGEHYGRSAAMTVLAEIKTINEMRRSLLRAQHLNLNPPTLIHSELGTSFRVRPGDVNAGMVSQDGKPLAIPFQMGERFQPAENEMERIRTVINDAFLITLFQILIERPQQTATETLQRAKEQAVLVAPLIGRLQSEFLGTMIESEMDILAEYGSLPQLPPELIEARGEYQITYQSDIVRALQTGELMAYRNWFADVAPMAEVNPELLEIVDHESILREAAERRGIPSRHIRTDEQLAALREQKAASRAQMEVIPAAQELAAMENTRAKTDQLRRRA